MFAETVGKSLPLKEEGDDEGKLSLIDQFLPLWIISAMILGILLSYYTDSGDKLGIVEVDSVSLPIALGLWGMMWPVLCKVRYEILPGLFMQKDMQRQMLFSVFLNWVIGPAIMTGLAWLTLPDLPLYRNGVIIVGMARCIAMVLIWNQLAGGDPEYCAIFVALNSVLQIVLFAPMTIFYLQVVSRQYIGDSHFKISFWDVARNVLIFLGSPLVAGICTRYLVKYIAGEKWLNEKFLPRFGPLALLSLVYTIIIIFTFQGNRVINEIGSVCRVAVPMFLYFILLWFCVLMICRMMGFSYKKTVTQAFTASSNNFELAIAISVAVFGIDSQEALSATIGPLIEVPVLLVLVFVARWLRLKLTWVEEAP